MVFQPSPSPPGSDYSRNLYILRKFQVLSSGMRLEVKILSGSCDLSLGPSAALQGKLGWVRAYITSSPAAPHTRSSLFPECVKPGRKHEVDRGPQPGGPLRVPRHVSVGTTGSMNSLSGLFVKPSARGREGNASIPCSRAHGVMNTLPRALWSPGVLGQACGVAQCQLARGACEQCSPNCSGCNLCHRRCGPTQEQHFSQMCFQVFSLLSPHFHEHMSLSSSPSLCLCLLFLHLLGCFCPCRILCFFSHLLASSLTPFFHLNPGERLG